MVIWLEDRASVSARVGFVLWSAASDHSMMLPLWKIIGIKPNLRNFSDLVDHDLIVHSLLD
jgi:hypothetical protein